MTTPPTTEVLGVGTRAPDFELRDQHGATVVLSRVLKRRNALLVFFPAVFSSVCGDELRQLRDWWPGAGRHGTALLAVSCDPMFSLRGYSDAEGIDYPLLSDFWPHGAVAAAYGVFDEVVGTSRRSSYLLDRSGRVAWSVHNARTDARPLSVYRSALDAVGG